MRRLTDRQEIEYVFNTGSLYGDRNSNNYINCPEYISFYLVDDVCFAGVRPWGRYARILDRYFVYPEARREGLRHSEHFKLMADAMIEDCGSRIPFFSVEKQRQAAVAAADILGWQVSEQKYNTIDSMQWIVMEDLNEFQGFGLSAASDGEPSRYLGLPGYRSRLLS